MINGQIYAHTTEIYIEVIPPGNNEILDSSVHEEVISYTIIIPSKVTYMLLSYLKKNR